jgi:inorganic pyrophosphatase
MKIGQRWVDAIERSDSLSEWVPFVVEIACGSRMKYALDKRSGQLELNRALEDGITYPTNYGFIPRTYCKSDGMELDLMTISSEPMLPLTIARVRIVGGCTLESSDEAKPEDKILGVLVADPNLKAVSDIDDVDKKLKAQIEEFFKTYKDDEAEEVKFAGWFDRLTGLDKVKHALKAAKKQRK